mmetsp:Transcript_143728/g.261473  ORF Transcript_143728/g.261473 Transcript_143728/m.261473 type:complete len:118 (+) Transcript_143728:178-531(+)
MPFPQILPIRYGLRKTFETSKQDPSHHLVESSYDRPAIRVAKQHEPQAQSPKTVGHSSRHVNIAKAPAAELSKQFAMVSCCTAAHMASAASSSNLHLIRAALCSASSAAILRFSSAA